MKQGKGMLARFSLMAMFASMAARASMANGPHHTAVSMKHKGRDGFMFNTRKAHRDRVRGLRSSGRAR